MTATSDKKQAGNKLRTSASSRLGCVTRSPTIGSQGVPDRQRSAFVYCVVASDSLHVKIGVAADPVARVAMLQTAHHEELILAGYLVSDRPTLLECELHKRFAADRVRGEWFAMSPDLDAFIRNEIAYDWEGLTARVEVNRRRADRLRKRGAAL